MKLLIGSSRGSLSLSMVASMLSGLLAILLFADLIRFTVASHAVQQAARKAARCLTPTDPKCVSSDATSPPGERDWYASHRGSRETLWVDRFFYEGIAHLQLWEASFSGYRIHLVQKPPVRWSALQIPFKTFQGGLNRYEYRVKRIAAQVVVEEVEQQFRVPSAFRAALTYFPDFDATYEVALDRAPVELWNPRVLRDRANLSRGFRDFPELVFHTTMLPNEIIAAGEIQRFSTELFEVPILPADSPSSICEDAAGRPCDIRQFAGSAGAQDYSWQRYAALAIKPFALVRRVSGAPSIKWAGGQGSGSASGPGWGLQIEVISAADYQSYRTRANTSPNSVVPIVPEPLSSIRCLGGRFSSAEITGNHFQPFHLWLRGPKGSNGGGAPNCPASQNSSFSAHDSMFVERGGAFRITGFLEVSGSGAVEASVQFKHYFDTYAPFPKTHHRERSCFGSARSPADESDSACFPDAVCGDAKVVETRSCSVLSIERQAICIDERTAASDPYAHALPEVRCGDSVTGATCDSEFLPSLPADCSDEKKRFPERVNCGWSESSVLRDVIELAETPELCPEGTIVEKESDCGSNEREIVYKVENDFGDVALCPRVAEVTTSYRARRDAINHNQPTGFPRFSGAQTISARWSEESPPHRWAPSFSLPKELRDFASDPEVVEKGIIKSKNVLPVYRRKDNHWQPPLSVFGFYGATNHATPVAFDLIDEERIRLNGAYPFKNQPEYEIPASLPGEVCDGPEADLESRLRAYAAVQLPALMDSEIEFQSSARYADSIPAQQSSTCAGTQVTAIPLPQCTKLSYHQVERDVCPLTTYLGRFDSTNHPFGPASCLASSDVECRSEPVVQAASTQPFSENFDIAAAQRAGHREIQRAFSGAVQGCNGKNCTKVLIAELDPDHLQINVLYELPLTFPLSMILGSESLTVKAEKLELRERRVAGRYAGAAYGDPES